MLDSKILYPILDPRKYGKFDRTLFVWKKKCAYMEQYYKTHQKGIIAIKEKIVYTLAAYKILYTDTPTLPVKYYKHPI